MVVGAATTATRRKSAVAVRLIARRSGATPAMTATIGSRFRRIERSESRWFAAPLVH
jgi:hypothetical protein